MAPSNLARWAAAQFGGDFVIGKRFKATRVEDFDEAVDQGVIGHEGIIAGGVAAPRSAR